MLEGKWEVRLLTRKPEQWNRTISVEDDLGNVYASPLSVVTNDAKQAVSDADIVLLCLPGFAISDELKTIKPFLSDNTIVGSVVCSTGFFFDAFKVLGKEWPLFGFQRVPFVARIAEYGKRSFIWGYRKEVFLATYHTDSLCTDRLRNFFCEVFGTPISLLDNYLEAALTNSNPILHTGRLYSMWKDWDGKPYSRQTLFYKEWTEEASRTIIDMDKEFFGLLAALNVRQGAISTLLEHYESTDATSMTAKIQSIPSLSRVLSPMKAVEGGYIPDFQSRYFTEDFPYGLAIIHRMAHENSVCSPTIDKIFNWGMEMLRLYSQ
jgi:hypothetical protein